MALRIEDVEKQLQEQGQGRLPGRAPVVTYGLPLKRKSVVVVNERTDRHVILITITNGSGGIQQSNKGVGCGTKLSAAVRAHYMKH